MQGRHCLVQDRDPSHSQFCGVYLAKVDASKYQQYKLGLKLGLPQLRGDQGQVKICPKKDLSKALSARITDSSRPRLWLQVRLHSEWRANGDVAAQYGAVSRRAGL